MPERINKDGSYRWQSVSQEGSLADGDREWTERLPVPGGWIYRTYRTGWQGVGLCFVPDPSGTSAKPVAALPDNR